MRWAENEGDGGAVGELGETERKFRLEGDFEGVRKECEHLEDLENVAYIEKAMI